MEVAGEVEEADQMSRSYAVKNVLEEIAVRLEGLSRGSPVRLGICRWPWFGLWRKQFLTES